MVNVIFRFSETRFVERFAFAFKNALSCHAFYALMNNDKASQHAINVPVNNNVYISKFIFVVAPKQPKNESFAKIYDVVDCWFDFVFSIESIFMISLIIHSKE